MSAQEFSLAMGEISDKYINEAIAYHCEKKQAFPVRHKWLTRVACLFLVQLLSGSAVLTFSVEARAAVFGWMKQQIEGFYVYFFEGNATVTDPARYELGWMPDNCIFVVYHESDGGGLYIYTDENDMLIQFSYTSDPNSGNMYISSNEDTRIEATVNGNPAEILISQDEKITNGIIWQDTETSALFCISGPFDSETLVKMAESVQKIEE